MQDHCLEATHYIDIRRCRGRHTKTTRETIMKYLEVNELDPNMVYGQIL